MKLHFNDHCLQVIGELTRHTVPDIKKQQFKAFVASAILKVDLAKVDKVDTSGLAWLLLLQSAIEKNGHQLQLLNVSRELTNLASLSGVAEFLPITDNN